MTTQILLIDPDINFMVGIKTALDGTHEFRVSVAQNGWAADELLRHGSPDVAVVDFDVPDMDIMELLQRIRQIRPNLPVILTPYSPQQSERAHLLGVNEILSKPYSGRDLIPVVRAALVPAPPEVAIEPPLQGEDDVIDDAPVSIPSLPPLVWPDYDSLPPADILEEFEALEDIQTTRLDDPPMELPASQMLRDALDQAQAERDLGATRFLDEVEEDDAPTTTVLEEDDTTQPTRSLSDTEELDKDDVPDVTRPFDRGGTFIELGENIVDEFYDPYDPYGESAPIIERSDGPPRSDAQAGAPDDVILSQTKPLPSRYDEPPAQEGDTPSVPEHDSDAMRTFLATDQGDVPPDDFGEALDAVGRVPLGTETESPDDFHDLVDSMRPSESDRSRVSRLEELIQSLGTDRDKDDQAGSSDAAVDFVLDAMRKGKSPLGSSAPLFDLDDATIGEVIDGLFEPSFEGVLAAMAGESVDEDTIQEPTYDAEGTEPDVDDQATPSTLPEESLLDFTEPPLGEEDSRRYPATAALTALSGTAGDEEDEGRFLLDDLLEKIESQLPPARSHRPRLKPLPSWQQADLVTGTDQVVAMFDHVEGVRPDPDVLETAEPRIEEPDISEDDTLPSQALLDTIDTVQDDSTRPMLPLTAESIDDEFTYETKVYTGQDTDENMDRAVDQAPDFDDDFDFDAEFELPDFDDEPEFVSRLLESPDQVGEADEVWTLDEGDGAADILGEDTRPDVPVAAVEDGGVDGDQPPHDEFDTAFDVDFDTEMLTMEDLLAIADLPVEAGTEEIQREIMERAAAAGRSDQLAEREQGGEADHYADEFVEAGDPVELDEPDVKPGADMTSETDEGIAFDMSEYDTKEFVVAEAGDPVQSDESIAFDVSEFEADELEEAEVEADAYAESDRADSHGAEDAFDTESDEAAYYANLASDTAAQGGIFPPNEDELVPMDSDTAAMIIETGASSLDEMEQIEDGEDDAVIAAIAVQLTQFSLESSSQATMISRSGQRLAEAGDLSDAAMDDLFEVVDRAWQSEQASDSFIRYITLSEAGEFLLYSTLVEQDLMLSMIFHSAIPVRTIRKQARRLSESLALVPEDGEPLAAQTLPSRPTDMQPPDGWAEAVKTAGLALDESVPVRPERDEEEAYSAYTCLWLPSDPQLELLDDLADGLADQIEEIAADNAWDVDDLTIFPDYVLLSLRAPENMLPDSVIMHLMDETSRLSADEFSGAVNGGPFWTDGYYLVSPPRELSEREIARFITYQRQAQLG